MARKTPNHKHTERLEILARELEEQDRDEDVRSLRWVLREVLFAGSHDWMQCGEPGHRWRYCDHGEECPACKRKG